MGASGLLSLGMLSGFKLDRQQQQRVTDGETRAREVGVLCTITEGRGQSNFLHLWAPRLVVTLHYPDLSPP